MLFSAFRDMKASAQLLMGLFVIMVCAFFGLALSYLLSLTLFGGHEAVSLLYAQQDFTNSTYISLLRFSQVFQSVFLFGVSSFAMAYFFAEKPMAYLYLDAKPSVLSVIYCFLAFLFLIPITTLSGLVNEQMQLPAALSSLEQWMKSAEDFAQFVVQKMVDEPSAPVWINYVVIAMVPAIVEELLFRGALQRLFLQLTKNKHWGIWIGALVFSAIHMQFYGFLPRLFLGAIFGYIVYYSGSLWITIALHFINNTLALYFEFYKGNFNGMIDTQASGIFPEAWSDLQFSYVALAFVGAMASIYLLQRVRAMNKC